MSDVSIEPISTPFRVSFRPPGSKSLTNRALVLAALAGGTCRLSNVLFADDTRVMLINLGRLGYELRIDEGSASVQIEGRGGQSPLIPATDAELLCGNSGTTIRFLSALCALGRGRFTLDGVARMRQRPIGQLIEMLHNLGVRSRYLGAEGFPPVEILADGLPGGLLTFDGGQSSQYLSAILQISPYARHEVNIDLRGRQSSWPYVEMTMRLMDIFGQTPHLVRDPRGEPLQIIIPAGVYAPTDYAIEPDASNATYFMAAAALHEGAAVTIEGLGKDSLQGDVAFAEILRSMGAEVSMQRESLTITGTGRLEGIEADMLAMPDTAQTLAVLALFADGPTTLRGLHTLRVKETDRVAALAAELSKLGARVQVEGDEAMTITPPDRVGAAAIDTYDDHRMAMSVAIAATKAPGIVIKNAECVNKTYPAFFDDLRRLGCMMRR